MNTSQRHDKTPLLQPTVKAITTVLGLPSSIWLLDETEKVFRIAAAAELIDEYIHNVYLSLDETCVAAEVFRTRETIIVKDIESDKRWKYKTEALEMGWKSAVVAPLWLKRKIGGILDIYVPEGVTFNTDEKMPIIECFASQIGATLRQVQGLETLNEVARLINLVTDQNSDLFDRILQSVQKVLDCKHVSIFLEDKGGDLVLEATSAPQIKRKRFKPGEGLAGHVVQTGKSLLASDVRQHPQFVLGLSTEVEERSMLLTPILFQNTCTGVISANIDELNGFDECDQKLMETLTSQIAIAIHNMQLFQMKQEQQQQAQTLQKIAQIVNSTLNREKVCTFVLDHLREFIEYDCASIQLIQGDQRTLIAYRGIPTETFSPKLCCNVSEDPLVSKIVAQKTPEVISDTGTSELWDPMDSTSHVKSWIGVPLIVQEQVVGLLTTDHSRVGYYTGESGEIVAAFSNHVATALFNADLYQREHNQAQALTELHNLAQNLLSIEKTQDIRNLLERIARIAKEVLKADLIDLYEYRQDQNTYELPQITVGKRLIPPVLKKQKIYKDSSIYKLIHRTEPLYVEDARSEAAFSTPYKIKRHKNHPKERYIFREKICSTAVIPLRKENENMGLMFVNYRTPQVFNKKKRELIELFANQAAIAIKNTRLYYYVNKRREALVKIGKELTAGMRLREDEVLDLIYKQATTMLGMNNLTIALYDETTDIVRFAVGTIDGRRVDVENEPGWEPRQGGNGKTEKIIKSKQYLLVPTRKELKEMEFSRIPGHKDVVGTLPSSWLGVPMIVGDKVLGVIANYDYGGDNFYNEDDIEILQALADYAAIAIDNARLYYDVNQKLKQISQRWKTLVHVGQKLTSGIRLQENEILELIYQQAKEILPINIFYIALYDEETNKISPALAMQNDEPIDTRTEGWKPRRSGKGMTEEVIRKKEPIFIKTRKEEQEWFEKPGRKPYVEQDSSTILVPMLIGEKAIGAIGVRHPTQEYAYTKDDLRILQALADQAAIALENVHLYNSLKEAEKLQSYLFRISEAAHIAQNLEKLFPVIHNIVSELMPARNFYIALYDSDTEILSFPYYVNENTLEKPFPQKLGAGLTAYVLRTGKPLLASPENFNELSESHEIILSGGKAVYWLGIPLKTQEKAIGVLAVQSYKKGISYGTSEQDILMFVSTQIATAIERVHAHDQLERRTEELRESKQRLSDIINFLPDATFVIDRDGKVIAWNRAIEAMIGVKAEDMVGKGDYEYAIPFYGKKRPILIDLVIKPDKKYEKKYDYIKKQNETLVAENYLPHLKEGGIYVYAKASPLYDSKRKVIGSILTIRDITDHKRAEERLEKLNQLGQKLTSSIQLTENQILCLIYENASEMIDTRNMFVALYNEVSDEVRFPLAFRNSKPIHIAPRKAENGYIEELIRAKTPTLHSTKTQVGHKNNIPDKPGLSWIGGLMSIGEKTLGVIATYNTEKENVYNLDDLEFLQSIAGLAAIALYNVRLVSEIANRERELVMSGLAMDFAHRMNNVAGTIPPWVILVKRELSSKSKQNPKVTEYLNNIVRDASRILNEAHKLRKPIAGPENVDIEEVIGSIVGQAEMMISPDIEIVFEPEAQLLPVRGVKQLLSVAIDSIFQNAVKSISGQGKITIGLKNDTSAAGDKKFVVITITDTGCGIPEDRFESIFAYSNSYWKDKKGTGYGLWRARNIIQSIGGSIKVTSSVMGKGTTFTIVLPVAE